MAYNVLIVDDSLTARTFIARTLEISGVSLNQVFQARNGQEALETLQQEWVDLVFADINMPVMNGVELVRRMRDKDLLKTIPVIVITGNDSATADECIMRGAVACLRKPVNDRVLLDAITAAIARSAANPPPQP